MYMYPPSNSQKHITVTSKVYHPILLLYRLVMLPYPLEHLSLSTLISTSLSSYIDPNLLTSTPIHLYLPLSPYIYPGLQRFTYKRSQATIQHRTTSQRILEAVGEREYDLDFPRRRWYFDRYCDPSKRILTR